MSGTTLATRGLNLPSHDYVEFDPPAAPAPGTQDILFKRGGSSGTLVATLTLSFDGSGDLVSVTKS